MSKYEQLTRHLASTHRHKIPMRFQDIEDVLGFGLPPSARRHRAWWSNNPSNSVMTKAWLAAGYLSEQVDLEGEKLVFARLNAVDSTPSVRTATGRHPLIGCMAGTILLAADTDLAEPTAPDWPDRLLEKFDRLLGRHK